MVPPATGADETPQAVGILVQGLNRVYALAAHGGFGFKGAAETAESYRRPGIDTEDAIRNFVNAQIVKASAVGFVTNLGGLITLPVALPASLTGALYIQLNMVTGIAHLRGYDINSDHVRTGALVCLAGGGVARLLRDAGVQIGTKLTEQAIRKVSAAALTRINQAVGFRLASKAGATGIARLSMIVPLVGGLVGGTLDGTATKAIATVARRWFPAVHPP